MTSLVSDIYTIVVQNNLNYHTRSELANGVCEYTTLILLFGKRVHVAHEVLKPHVQQMRINLCRRDIRVPEHLLDQPQVRAVSEQVTCEGVA